MRKVIVSVLGLLILSGCATMNKTMASWEGSHVRDLLISWGRPSEVYSDGEGGAVLVYRYTETYTTPAQSTTRTTANATSVDPSVGVEGWNIQSRTVYQPAYVETYTKYRAFWVNKEGIIYSWRWRGL